MYMCVSVMILSIEKKYDRTNVNNICYMYARQMWFQLCRLRFRVMAFNVTFNNISVISWQSVLLVEENGVPGKNHRPVASHWQTLSHNNTEYSLPWTGFKLTTLVVIGTDCTGSRKSNYHMMTTTMAAEINLTI
jgi:hypothetical protein